MWITQADGLPVSDAVREAYVSSFSTRHQFDLDSLVRDIAVEAASLAYIIDLRPFMDPSPMTVSVHMPLTRVYNLFNFIGVRHIPVVNRLQHLVGIITRKDTLPELLQMRLSGAAAKRFSMQKQKTSMRLDAGSIRRLTKRRASDVSCASARDSYANRDSYTFTEGCSFTPGERASTGGGAHISWESDQLDAQSAHAAENGGDAELGEIPHAGVNKPASVSSSSSHETANRGGSGRNTPEANTGAQSDALYHKRATIERAASEPDVFQARNRTPSSAPEIPANLQSLYVSGFGVPASAGVVSPSPSTSKPVSEHSQTSTSDKVGSELSTTERGVRLRENSSSSATERPRSLSHQASFNGPFNYMMGGDRRSSAAAGSNAGSFTESSTSSGGGGGVFGKSGSHRRRARKEHSYKHSMDVQMREGRYDPSKDPRAAIQGAGRMPTSPSVDGEGSASSPGGSASHLSDLESVSCSMKPNSPGHSAGGSPALSPFIPRRFSTESGQSGSGRSTPSRTTALPADVASPSASPLAGPAPGLFERAATTGLFPWMFPRSNASSSAGGSNAGDSDSFNSGSEGQASSAGLLRRGQNNPGPGPSPLAGRASGDPSQRHPAQLTDKVPPKRRNSTPAVFFSSGTPLSPGVLRESDEERLPPSPAGRAKSSTRAPAALAGEDPAPAPAPAPA